MRGPFSTLYGSQALGGVVQILTGGPRGLHATIEGGSDDYRRGAVSGGFERGAFRFDAAGHVRRGEGSRLDNDFYDGEEATARGEWTVRPGGPGADGTLGIGLVARASHAEIGLPFDFADGPAPNRVQERDTAQLAVPVRWAPGGEDGRWRVDGRLGHTTTDLSLRDPDNPFDESDTDAERISGRLVVTRHFDLASGAGDGRSSWVAVGADWQEEEVTDANSFLDFDRSRATRAAFGELFLGSGPWTVDLGVRHDDDEAFGGETTVKAAGSWRLGRGVRLRGGYGEGFRAPSLGDLYYPGFGNPDLRPETSESWEVGADWRPGTNGPWSLSLVGFSNDFENLIVFDFVSGLPQNVGRSRARGVEAAVAYERPAFAGRLSATWQDAEDRTTGEPLLRRPDESAEALLTWRPLWAGERDWTLHAGGRYVGERADFGRDLPSHTVVDLAASYRWTDRLAPRVRLENALDEDYEEVAGFPAPERTWVVGLATRPVRRLPGLRALPPLAAALLLACWAGWGCGGDAPPDRPAADPQRIVTLAPNLTEIAFELGLGDRVVGVSQYALWPPEAAERPRLGGLFDPNLERTVALEPDLAIVLPSQEEVARHLEGVGVPSLTVGIETLDDLEAAVRAIAERCGVPEAGKELAERLRRELAPRPVPGAPPAVVVLDRDAQGSNDGAGGLLVAGPGDLLPGAAGAAGLGEPVRGRAAPLPDGRPGGAAGARAPGDRRDPLEAARRRRPGAAGRGVAPVPEPAGGPDRRRLPGGRPVGPDPRPPDAEALRRAGRGAAPGGGFRP